MKRIIKFVAGYKRYTVQCSNPAKTAGMIMSEYASSIFDVKIKDSCSFEYSCLLTADKKILSLLDDRDCDTMELYQGGLGCFVRNKLKSPGLVAGLFIAVLTVFLQSNRVWDITVSGNRKTGDDEIIQTLSLAGFGTGMRYSYSELPEICNRFILLDDRFSYISINMSGNAAFVEVHERSKKEDLTDIPSESGIVAVKDCIIERPEVLRGTSLVSKGDVVSKGTLLISPIEKGKDENEYITGAMGKIYAKTYEDFVVCIPMKKTSVINTGESYTRHEISFLGMTLRYADPFGSSGEQYLCKRNCKKPGLGEDIKFPALYSTVKRLSYETEETTLTEEEAEKKAYEIMYKKLAEDLFECEILSLDYESEQDDEFFTLRCRAECIRDVALRID